MLEISGWSTEGLGASGWLFRSGVCGVLRVVACPSVAVGSGGRWWGWAPSRGPGEWGEVVSDSVRGVVAVRWLAERDASGW